MTALTRVAGCLVGQCIADAMGAPVEGCTPGEATQWADLFREFGPRRVIAETGIGQYTDDSQLARELMISIVECEGFDPAHYASRVMELHASGRIVGIGAATHRSAVRLSRGIAWDASGEPAPAAGNGTAMRAAPVGFLRSHPEARARAAHEQGFCTHQDRRCSAGSVAVAEAVAILSALPSGEPIDRDRFCTTLAERMAPWHEEFAGLVRTLPDLVDLPGDYALARIVHAGLIEEEEAIQTEIWPGISPFVIPTVLWSLRCVLAHPDDFVAGVLATIEGGGDADSTAAITGAILGARLGVEGIPDPFAAMVHDQGEWGLTHLLDLASRFCIAVNTAD